MVGKMLRIIGIITSNIWSQFADFFRNLITEVTKCDISVLVYHFVK